MLHRASAWVAISGFLVATILAPAQTAPPPPRPALPEVHLARSGLRGDEAIRSLADKLPAVAAHYRKTPAELTALFQQDHRLALDDRGRLFYTCDFELPPVDPEAVTNHPPSRLALFPLSQTFLLHSKPGASKTIYLDFDGHTMSGNGWTASYNGGADIIAPPWDTDGNPGSFSTSEQTAIQQIWFRVAEDYAPYDVDVTTHYPGETALTRSSTGDTVFGTRALISAISSYIGNYGGIAYVGVFDDTGDYYKPALVFPEKLGNSEKNIAEAITHEVGHNLGLSHDGTTAPVEYYSGQGNWAPIMGVGYYKPISQWSKGEYAAANNTQDDLTVITQNGLAYRTDDYGNDRASAFALAGTSMTNSGVIERTTDVDYFSFLTGAGTAQISVTPWERGANLHLQLSVYDSTGTLVTNREVADNSSSGVLAVAVNQAVASDTYYVAVAGLGSGDPLTTGYSDYASLGNYTLAINLPTTAQWLTTAPGTHSWAAPMNWVSGNVPNAANVLARLNNNIAGDQIVTLDAPFTVGQLVLGDSDASHGFTLTDGLGGALTFDVVTGKAAILKTAGTNDIIAASLTLADPLTVSNSSSAPLTLAGLINGAAKLTKTGSGPVVFAGTNNFTGGVLVAAGSVLLDSDVAFTNGFSTEVATNAVLDVSAANPGFAWSDGQVLAGDGAILGNAVFATDSVLLPGGTNRAGTLSFSNSLVATGGANWVFDLSPGTTVGSGVNDLIVVAGDVTLSGLNTIQINPIGSNLSAPGSYKILTYSGTLTGGSANLTVSNPTRYTITVNDSIPGELWLEVSGNPTNLVWRGDGVLNRWEVGAVPNWQRDGNSDVFAQFDAVTFDDSGSNSPVVNLISTLMPASVTVAGTKNYTFGGAGRLTGAATLIKNGSGTLTLSNANDFSGEVAINGGLLKTAAAGALGSSAGGTTVAAGAALDLAGFGLGAESVSVAGAGAGSGAIINSGSTQSNALQFVTLTGHTTLGGTGRWDIRANPTGALAGGGFNLTKMGVNEIWLAGLGDSGLGDIDVRQGGLGIQTTTGLGITTNALTLATGTSLAIADTAGNLLNKILRSTNAVIRNDSGSNVFVGPVTLVNSNQFTITGGLELRGDLNGSGTLSKSGTGTLTISGSNTVTGALYLDSNSTSTAEGNVKLVGSNALRSATAIYIRNNNSGSSTLQLDGLTSGVTVSAPLTLSGRNSSPPAVQNLRGTNTFSGNLALLTGGGNYCFQSDAGLLVLSGSLPLSTPGSARVLKFQGSGDTLVTGTLQNGTGGGTVGLLKAGSGRLILTGNANSYTGATTNSAGTLQLGNGGAGGKLGSGALVNNGLLQFNRSDTFTWNTPVTGTNGQFIKLNTNLVALTATNFFLYSSAAGAAQIAGGTLQLSSTGRLIVNNEFWIAPNASTGACVINGGTLIVSNWIAIGRNNSAATGALTLNSGQIQKLGGGSVILGSLGGSGSLTVNGGVFSNNARLLLAEGATGKGYLDLNGGVVQASDVTKYGGLTAIARFNGGTLQATTNNTAFISGLNQALIQTGGLVLDDAGFALTNPQTLLEDASAPGGGLTKQGSGSLALTAVNTFRGDTRIAAGTLRLGNSAGLQFSTVNLAPADSGTLQFYSIAAATLGGLAGSRDLALTNEAGGAMSLTVGGNNSNTIYSGSLSGSGALTKTGSGSLTLAGANTHTGSTVVDAGTLVLDGVVGPGPLTVGAATLQGNGVSLGPVAVSGGVLSPGNPLGQLTVSNSLTLSADSSTVMEITSVGPANDRLLVSDTLNCAGALIVTNVGPALAAGNSFPLFSVGSLTGWFSSVTLPALPAGLLWNTNQLASAGILSVDAIPAPALSLALSGTNLSLQFETQPGFNYVLQSATNLTPPVAWGNVQTNLGNGLPQSIDLPVDAQWLQLFFRLFVY